MIVGIDIGTSTLSIVLADSDGRQVEVQTLNNDSALAGEPCNRLQDPEWICRRIGEALKELRARHTIDRVGLACQMHGILYVDEKGRAVSPLYTWQDETGQRPCPQGGSWLEALNARTGERLIKGIAYGGLTHFALTCEDRLPPGAVQFCSIGDYVAMRLCGLRRPLTHVSNAAGFGLYDLEGRCFDREKIERAGMDPGFFPEIQRGRGPVGRDAYAAAVFAALGDNQASFLGSVSHPEQEILLNLGTGGQISCCVDDVVPDPRIDTRPLLEDSFLAVYTSHCAGRAYAALERFFREVLTMAGCPADSLYEHMKAEVNEPSRGGPMRVETTFCGSRADPDAKCVMSGITLENFTPGMMIRGFMKGICMEMYPFYEHVSRTRRFSWITGSGNLIRRNPAMRTAIEETFGLPVQLSEAREETAMGAIRYAMHMAQYDAQPNAAKQGGIV